MKKFCSSFVCALSLFACVVSGASVHAEILAYDWLLHHESSHAKTSQFQSWVVDQTKHLVSHGKIVQTSIGPVQYVLKGRGPIILSLHGGFGGWDQGLLVADQLVERGFSVLSVSRPGYLGSALPVTPPVEFTPEEQAQVMYEVLNALSIQQVAVLGFSAGAPVAYSFAQQYPDRTWACVLESIGANPSEDFPFYLALAEVLELPVLPDFETYLLDLSARFDFYSTAKLALGSDTNLIGDGLGERIRYATKHDHQNKFLKHFFDAVSPITPRLPGILNDFLGVDYWTTTFSPVGFNTPTIIFQALNDSNGYYPTAVGVSLALPTSQLVTIQESGHLIWLGPQTNVWEAQLIGFLYKYMPTK